MTSEVVYIICNRTDPKLYASRRGVSFTWTEFRHAQIWQVYEHAVARLDKHVKEAARLAHQQPDLSSRHLAFVRDAEVMACRLTSAPALLPTTETK